MNKIKISGLSNYGNETYVRLKVDKHIIRRLIPFLRSFGGEVWDFNFEEASYGDKALTEKKFFDPKYWLDNHIHNGNNGFDIHIIFGKNNIHLLIKHDLKNKAKLIKAIEDYCEWVKPSPVKNKKTKPMTNKKRG